MWRLEVKQADCLLQFQKEAEKFFHFCLCLLSFLSFPIPYKGSSTKVRVWSTWSENTLENYLGCLHVGDWRIGFINSTQFFLQHWNHCFFSLRSHVKCSLCSRTVLMKNMYLYPKVPLTLAKYLHWHMELETRLSEQTVQVSCLWLPPECILSEWNNCEARTIQIVLSFLFIASCI